MVARLPGALITHPDLSFAIRYGMQSYHYLPPSAYVIGCTPALIALARKCARQTVAPSMCSRPLTTDAPFRRETAYQHRDAVVRRHFVAVEMEAARFYLSFPRPRERPVDLPRPSVYQSRLCVRRGLPERRAQLRLAPRSSRYGVRCAWCAHKPLEIVLVKIEDRRFDIEPSSLSCERACASPRRRRLGRPPPACSGRGRAAILHLASLVIGRPEGRTRWLAPQDDEPVFKRCGAGSAQFRWHRSTAPVLCAAGRECFLERLGPRSGASRARASLALPVSPAWLGSVHSSIALACSFFVSFFGATMCRIAAIVPGGPELPCAGRRPSMPPDRKRAFPPGPVAACRAAARCAPAGGDHSQRSWATAVSRRPIFDDHAKVALIDDMRAARLPPAIPSLPGAKAASSITICCTSRAELARLLGVTGWEPPRHGPGFRRSHPLAAIDAYWQCG